MSRIRPLLLIAALVFPLACSDETSAPSPDAGAISDLPGNVEASVDGASDAPADQGSTFEPFSFFAFGDTRSNPDVLKQNIATMVALDPQAIGIFNGGDLTDSGSAAEWTVHHQMLREGGQELVRPEIADWTPGKLRYIGVLGNHELYDADGFANWNTFLPGQANLGPNPNEGVYFTLRYQDTLFVILDSVNPSAKQTAWLEKVLSEREASIRWTLVFFHYPIYPCNSKDPFAAGVEWARLFEQYGVDIAFVAHSHTYERTCPMVGGKCQEGGVIYLNTSAGAAPPRDVDATRQATVGTDSYHCAPQNNEAGILEPGILDKGIGGWWHYCHLEITDGQLTLRALSHDSTVDERDRLVLTK